MNAWNLASLAVHVFCSSRVGATACSKEQAAPERLRGNTEYVRDLISLEKHALEFFAKELERTANLVQGLRKIECVERHALVQLEDLGKCLGELRRPVDVAGSDVRRGAETLVKSLVDLGRSIRELENTESLVREESTALMGLVTDDAWCPGQVFRDIERPGHGHRMHRHADPEELGAVLRKLEHFEVLRGRLSSDKIEGLGLRCLDLGELRKKLSGTGLCPEDLESPEGITRLRHGLEERIERLESARTRASGLESIRRRCIERLSLRGISFEDVNCLVEDIDERLDRLESLEGLGKRLARLTQSLGESVKERLVDLESLKSISRVRYSEKCVQMGYHYDNNRSLYDLSSTKEGRAAAPQALRDDHRERIARRLVLRERLRSRLFVLRGGLGCLAEGIVCLSRGIERAGNLGRFERCLRGGVEVHINLDTFRKGAVDDLERLAQSARERRMEIRFLGQELDGYECLAKGLESLECDIAGKIAALDGSTAGCAYKARKESPESMRSRLYGARSFGMAHRKSIEGLAGILGERSCERKGGLATVFEKESLAETLERLRSSTESVLEEYRSAEKNRLDDFSRALESAESQSQEILEETREAMEVILIQRSCPFEGH